MNIKSLVIAALVSGVVLFLWSGFAQAVLPWGVPTAQAIISQTDTKSSAFQTHEGQVTTFKSNEFTTPQFDQNMVNRITTLTTDKTFSWIITKPLEYYNPVNYLVGEAITQVVIGLGLAFVLVLTQPLPLLKRLLIVGLTALLGGIASFGQMLNWWGMPLSYGLGMIANMVVGWLLAAFIVARFIVKSHS